MGVIVICFLTKKKMFKFEVNNKNISFSVQFCLGNITNKFNFVEAKKYYFKQMFMIFKSIKMLLINVTY